MEKGARLSVLFLLIFFLIPIISSISCNLEVSMINQDPYPAIPGDYVKVVFQITGIQNPECGIVSFEIKENYPFSLDPNVTNKIIINSGTYSRSYSSFYLATYKLRVDGDALEGNTPLEIEYSNKYRAGLLKEFDINIKDTRANFEIYVKNYDYTTRTLTFEILNIESVDVSALTIEIPKQEDIQIKGANRKVIGDLDSNEYTTADFEAILPEKESTIELNIIYTDSINVRREINKNVHFNPDYFTGRNGQKKSTWWIYIIVIAVIGWFVLKRIKKNKMKKRLMQKHHSGTNK